MGQLTAQLEEKNYFFSGGYEEVRFVADKDDEVKTTVSHRSVWQQVSTEEPTV